jgi:RimJ/RimL family protein N-acetyltransferase/GNAT superfamily N-acetyltransferase
VSRDRIRDFRLRLQECAAERTVATEHGLGVFCDSAPVVYDANFLRADVLAPAEQLAAEADAVMEPFFHRRVITEGEGAALAAEFASLGWSRSTHVIMEHRREPDRVVDTNAVREVPIGAIQDAHTEGTLAEPHGDSVLAEQLFLAKRRVAAAVPTRFFATYDGDRVTAYCELRNDGEVAQIEDVNTLADYRGRGLGRVVVQRALEEGRRAARVVFIEALADDWPRDLYAKLGFDVADERHLFLRPGSPLTRIRVRTPRLELRLATVAELRELALLAQAGIHDRERMPFEVAWTDDSDRPGFVQESIDHHVGNLQAWRPEEWVLGLVAFLDGRPVGVQSLRATSFATKRSVGTGSWLGRAFQGQGLGTEMRAGALTLAFEGLDAEVALSGAVQGNPQSLGVSRKLGYVVTGESSVSPRGIPVPHTDLELRREHFSSPVPVRLEGLDELEPLFGAR